MTTQAKHTEGPWEALEMDPLGKNLTFSYRIFSKSVREIALVFHHYNNGNHIDSANARLIATAPELLEATKDTLQSILAFYEVDLKAAGENFGAAFCERLKDLIAKAEGKL
jgi:hypothetical protein